MNNIDINGQIIFTENNVKLDINEKFNSKIIDNRLSIIGINILNNEKEIIKEILEFTKNKHIFSGIIEIRNDNNFIIMIYNILKGKWDIKQNTFL